jgi:hypothetical protein
MPLAIAAACARATGVRRGDDDLAHAGGCRFFLAFLRVGTVFSVARSEYQRLQRPVCVAFFHAVERECDNGVRGTQRGEHFQGGSRARGEAFLGNDLVSAQADEQHARRSHARNAAQQQGRTRLAADVAGLDRRADLAIHVECFCCSRQFFIFEHRHCYTAGLRRCQGVFCVECFYAKVHLVLRFVVRGGLPNLQL